MLVPAGILVLLMLGAIAVDSAIAFSAQRELENAAVAAANDAVTQAISSDELQLGIAARPDASLVDQLVHRRLDGASVGGVDLRAQDVSVVTDEAAGTVTVSLDGDVDYLFAPSVPGAKKSAHVSGSATASLTFRTPE